MIQRAFLPRIFDDLKRFSPLAVANSEQFSFICCFGALSCNIFWDWNGYIFTSIGDLEYFYAPWFMTLSFPLLLVIAPALLPPVVGGSLRQRPVWEASWLRERPAEAPVASREATGWGQGQAGAVVLLQSGCGPAVSEKTGRDCWGLWGSDTLREGVTAHWHGTLKLYSGEKKC